MCHTVKIIIEWNVWNVNGGQEHILIELMWQLPKIISHSNKLSFDYDWQDGNASDPWQTGHMALVKAGQAITNIQKANLRPE